MTAVPVIAAVQPAVVVATWRATWAMLEVVDAEGRRGLGEWAARGTPAEAQAGVEAVAPQLQGRTVAAARETSWGGSSIGHAVELALADLDAQARGEGLDLLPPARHRDRVKLYANINRAERDRTSAKLAALGARAVADGFTAIKLAPFDDADADHGLAHLRALRDAIGPDVELMVDCHNRLPLDETLRILPELEALDVVWLEDVLRMDDLEGWRRVHAATPMPLAAGEQATGLADLAPLLETGVLAHVLPDVKIAGVAGCREILTAALSAGADASLHNPTGPAGTAASLLVAASMPAFGRLEFAYGEVPWRAEVVDPAEALVDGSLPVPTGPGLGVRLSDAARARTLALAD